MATEIERKFLVTGDNWRNQAHGVLIKQGYLCADVQRAVRVRRTGTQAWLTIKGGGEGISRLEYEYPVPLQDADDLLALCLPGVISKTSADDTSIQAVSPGLIISTSLNPTTLSLAGKCFQQITGRLNLGYSLKGSRLKP